MTAAWGQLDLGGSGAHYAMVLLRVLGLFVFVPILGSELLPLRLRLGAAMVLALAFVPLAPRLDPLPADAAAWTLVGLRELAVGLGLGLAARAIFAGIEGAAGIVAGQSGFALANMIDPTSGDQALAPTLFHNLLSMSLFLAADLHHLFIHAVVASYEILPPAVAGPALDGLGQLAGAFGARLFGLAVELAAPALVVTFLVDLVLGLVGRAMPQVPILMVGYPLKMASGLVAMAVLCTATGSALGWIGHAVAADGALVLAALAGR